MIQAVFNFQHMTCLEGVPESKQKDPFEVWLQAGERQLTKFQRQRCN